MRSLMQLSFKRNAKRGDTIVEVMFAFAIFSLVAVLSIAMMNAGIAGGERSLELVTARNELNAQAEALRFIHSSYVSELTLPACTDVSAGEKCRQFDDLWHTITANAMRPYNPGDTTNLANYSIPYPLEECKTVYDDNNKLLKQNHAFVLNTRQINFLNNTNYGVDSVYVSSRGSDIFRPATLNARLVYVKAGASYNEDAGDSSVDVMSTNPLTYRKLGSVEGIWVVAVRETNSRYYDFYIQTCWYGSGSNIPTSLDAVIRLYDPEGI